MRETANRFLLIGTVITTTKFWVAFSITFFVSVLAAFLSNGSSSLDSFMASIAISFFSILTLLVIVGFSYSGKYEKHMEQSIRDRVKVDWDKYSIYLGSMWGEKNLSVNVWRKNRKCILHAIDADGESSCHRTENKDKRVYRSVLKIKGGFFLTSKQLDKLNEEILEAIEKEKGSQVEGESPAAP